MPALQLAVSEYGAGSPVVILHGLFGSARNWRSIAQRLAMHHRVLALDLRNHGASPWAEGMLYREMVEDLRASLAARGIGHATLIGHSMGGKVAMLAALLFPAEIDRLIVVDIAPAPNPPTLLAYVRAMRTLDLGNLTRRAEADTQLAAVVPDPVERAFLLQNLVLGNGQLHWRVNLEAIEGDFSAIIGFPELPSDASYGGPTLFIAGTRSNYIGSEHAPMIRQLFPQSRIERIDAAGHWVHAEQPEAFLRLVKPFLSGID